MERRIAIPVNGGKLSRDLGTCSQFRIFRYEGGIPETSVLEMPHDCALNGLPLWMSRQHITDIIAYRVEREIIGLFARQKINIWVGAPDEPPEILVREFLDGRLISKDEVLRD